MATILTQAPPTIAFSKNQIEVVFTSDDYIDIAGVKSVTNVTFFGTISAGNSFRLLWSNGDITFTASSLPNDSGTQFPTGSGDEAHVRDIIDALEENPYIAADFDLAYALNGSNPSMALTAKKTGAIYNIITATATPISVDAAVAGVTLARKPNFKLHVQLWLKVAGDFINVFTENIELSLPITGASKIDISDILDTYLLDISDKPDLAAVTWQACNNSLLEYYIKFGPYYGAQPTVKKLTKTASYFVNLGGLAVQAAVGQTMEGYLRPAGDDSKTLCLRQGSKNKTVRIDEPEVLYWVNLTGAAINIKLRIELFMTDGSASVVYHLLPFAALAYTKYYVSVNYAFLGIASNIPTGKTCGYYSVRVVSDTDVYLSATYNYQIDVHREWPYYFIFKNSLGGWQTLYTYGKASPETERSKDDIKKQVTPAQAAQRGRIYENNIRLQDKLTVKTGFASKRDIYCLKDLFSSDDKYWLFEGVLIPVGINNTNIKFAEDGDSLHSAAIEFYPLYDENVFTDNLHQAENSISSGGTGTTEGFNAIFDDGNNTDDIYYQDI
jgi:hypothetical protein